MKLDLSQHGGLAAYIRRPPIRLDTDALDERTRNHVEALARAVLQSSPAQVNPKPDEITYTLRLEDGDKVAEIRGSDTESGEDFSSLVQAVKKYGEKAKER